MKRITLLLVAAVAMMFSTAFAGDVQVKKAGKAIGAGKMKASVSAGFKMKSIKDVDDSMNLIEFAQLGSFAFLSPQAAGLSFGYGITDDMHVALSLPVFAMMSFGDDLSSSTTFGAPKLAFVYAKNMGAVEVTAAPYVSVPFVEMWSSKLGDLESDGDNNFKQPIAFGLNLAVDSAMPGKVFWGVWMNVYMSLEKEEDNVVTSPAMMLMNLSALVGYKVAPGMMVKFQLYFDTPNLQAEGDDAPGFADGNLKMKLVYGMKLNKTSGIHAGLLYGMGLSDKSSLNDTTLLGLIVDYYITF